jgi:hypothetical protein
MKDGHSVTLMAIIAELWKRTLPEGGFAMKPGGKYRTDATAWALAALSVVGERPDLLKPARSSLAINQVKNGMVPFSKDHSEAIWTTPIAILAWQGSNEFSSTKDKAVDFLLQTTGVHWTKIPDSPVGDDSALKGWPWTSKSHSWVEPTALSIIALRITGYEAHERIREALLMLMDRQFTKGGWNSGNRRVFGRELDPMPEWTGMALSSIAGMVPKGSVGESLNYLKSNIGRVLTPITLGWSLLGLSAYGERPDNAERLIIECFNHQKRYGMYDTVMLSLLIVAFLANDGIINAFQKAGFEGSREAK